MCNVLSVIWSMYWDLIFYSTVFVFKWHNFVALFWLCFFSRKLIDPPKNWQFLLTVLSALKNTLHFTVLNYSVFQCTPVLRSVLHWITALCTPLHCAHYCTDLLHNAHYYTVHTTELCTLLHCVHYWTASCSCYWRCSWRYGHKGHHLSMQGTACKIRAQ